MRMWMGGTARLISHVMMAAGISLIATVTNGQLPATPQAIQEINGLLEFIEQSECHFVRNGSEYSGSRARAHLEKKLSYLELSLIHI